MASDKRFTLFISLPFVVLTAAVSLIISAVVEKDFDERDIIASEGQIARKVDSVMPDPLALDQGPMTFDLSTDRLGREEERALRALRIGDKNFYRVVDDSLAYGYRLVRDERNKPAVLLRVDLDRPFHLEGKAVVKRYLMFVMGACAIALVTLIGALRSLVFNPIGRVRRHVRNITLRGAWQDRVREPEQSRKLEVLSAYSILAVMAVFFVIVAAIPCIDWPAAVGINAQSLQLLLLGVGLSTLCSGVIIFAMTERQISIGWDRLRVSLGRALAMSYDELDAWPQIRTEGHLVRYLNSILERRAIEAALPSPEEQARAEESAARMEFLAKVTHELRTPLHSILGVLRIIEKNDPRPLSLHYVRMVRDSARDLLSTINQVLDFSKADAGMLVMKRTSVNMRAIIREAIGTVAPLALAKEGLECVCEIDPNLPDTISSDGAHLRHVLVNLLGNAVKFTTTGHVAFRAAYVDATDEKPRLVITIRDTGMGIPVDRLAAIFEPFTQVESTITRKFQGTGLGLTIVKQIVSALDGAVSVKSTVGEGTEFTVSLPVLNAQGPVTAAFERLNRRTVAISMGWTDTREALTRTLEAYGCCCIGAGPGDLLLADYLIISSDQLGSASSMELLGEFAREKGGNAVVAILHPNDLAFNDDLFTLQITKVLPHPTMTDDVARCLVGDYEVAASPDEDASLEQASEPLSILVADDMPTNQLILRSLLEAAGHRVFVVNNGREILEAIEGQRRSGAERPFDIVLTDVQMPEMDGITATKILRENERTYGFDPLPIVAVTAQSFPEERERILAAGASNILTKPVEPRELEAILRTVKPNGREGAEISPSITQQVMVEQVDSQQVGISSPAPVFSVEPVVAAAALPAAIPMPSVSSFAASTGNELVDGVQSHLAELSLKVPIDFPSLFERSGDSTRRSLLILRAFVSGQTDLITRLEGKNWESEKELRRTVHSLKGLLLDAGVAPIADLAQEIEGHVRSGAMDDGISRLPELCQGVRDAVTTVHAVIDYLDRQMHGVVQALSTEPKTDVVSSEQQEQGSIVESTVDEPVSDAAVSSLESSATETTEEVSSDKLDATVQGTDSSRSYSVTVNAETAEDTGETANQLMEASASSLQDSSVELLPVPAEETDQSTTPDAVPEIPTEKIEAAVEAVSAELVTDVCQDAVPQDGAKPEQVLDDPTPVMPPAGTPIPRLLPVWAAGRGTPISKKTVEISAESIREALSPKTAAFVSARPTVSSIKTSTSESPKVDEVSSNISAGVEADSLAVTEIDTQPEVIIEESKAELPDEENGNKVVAEPSDLSLSEEMASAASGEASPADYVEVSNVPIAMAVLVEAVTSEAEEPEPVVSSQDPSRDDGAETTASSMEEETVTTAPAVAVEADREEKEVAAEADSSSSPSSSISRSDLSADEPDPLKEYYCESEEKEAQDEDDSACVTAKPDITPAETLQVASLDGLAYEDTVEVIVGLVTETCGIRDQGTSAEDGVAEDSSEKLDPKFTRS